MDCRFCCSAEAKYLNQPTLFGQADLCQECSERYFVYLVRYRRQKEKGKPGKAPPNSTTNPNPVKERICYDKFSN